MSFQTIALPPAYASFFELDLREYTPPRDGGPPQDSGAVLTELYSDLLARRLLLVHGKTGFDAREWARGVAQKLHAETELPVLEWQGFADGAPDALDLNKLFATGEEAGALSQPAIFIIPNTRQTELAEWLYALQPVLERRNQYAILATALPQACWQLTQSDGDAFWRAPRNMQTATDETWSETPCANKSGPTVNVDGIYRHLNRSEQLCLVGLCLCGELRDDHFFAAMERMIDEAWPALRNNVGLFDYAELSRLAPMLRYVDVQPGYAKIEQRTAGQRRQLLRLLRRSRWHHLRVALPVLHSLLEEWLGTGDEQNAEYAYVARSTAEALGDLARQSTGVVADLLWQLAASESPRVRGVAARVLAGDDPQEREQRDLYRLLEHWVRQQLPAAARKAAASAGDSDTPEERVAQTAAQTVRLVTTAISRTPDSPGLPAEMERVRELLQKPEESDAPAEEAVPPAPGAEPSPGKPIEPERGSTPSERSTAEEILEIARDPALHELAVERVSNRYADAAELTDVLREWQRRAANQREKPWLPVAFVAAHANFRRSLGADHVYRWLAAELIAAHPQEYETVATLLPHNGYLYDAVLRHHLPRLRYLLLYLAQNPAFRADLVALFTSVHTADPQAVRETLEAWYARWQQRGNGTPAWQKLDWDEVQYTVRDICLRVGCPGWNIWPVSPAAEPESVPAPGMGAPAEEASPLPVSDDAKAEATPEEAGAETPAPGSVDPVPQFEDLDEIVRHASLGDAERRQVIDHFVTAYRHDPAATQNRLNRVQTEALQKLNEDVNSSVEGLGLIGIIRDRIEDMEENDD